MRTKKPNFSQNAAQDFVIKLTAVGFLARKELTPKRGGIPMEATQDDAVTTLLKQLLKQHPDASDDEMWELFRRAAKDNDEVNAEIERLYINQARLN